MSGIKDAKRRRNRRLKNRPKRILILTFLSLFIFLMIVLGVKKLFFPPPAKEPEKAKQTASEKQKEPKKAKDSDDKEPQTIVEKATIKSDTPSTSDKKKKTTLTVSSVGDCTLGTDEGFDQSVSLNAYYNAQGADYFLQNVRPVFEQDDLTIVNMEGTLTEETARENKTFAFKAPPEYASILSGSSVEIANLANNHSKDYGEKSYTDTISTLKDANIPTFGYERTLLLDVKGVKVGVTGIYELADHLDRKKQVKQNIAALKKAGAQLIITNFHWGMEREYVPNDTQKTLAHLAIDEGADLVIGHHPHVLQGIEEYKGKYIAYSLGNFCFGGNSNPEDKDTIIFQQTFTINEGKVKKDENINIIPCSISSGSKNNYCPTPLEGAEKERVLQKVQKYSEEL